jgi:hypothetical protein
MEIGENWKLNISISTSYPRQSLILSCIFFSMGHVGWEMDEWANRQFVEWSLDCFFLCSGSCKTREEPLQGQARANQFEQLRTKELYGQDKKRSRAQQLRN